MVLGRQRGASLWTVIVIALMAVFYVLLGLKLFPVYMTGVKTDGALKRLAKEAGASEMTPVDIRERLEKVFLIEDLDRVIDLRTALKITTRSGTRYVSISYETVTPIAGPFSVLGEFDYEVGMGKVGP